MGLLVASTAFLVFFTVRTGTLFKISEPLRLNYQHFQLSINLQLLVTASIMYFYVSCVLFDDCGLDLCFSPATQMNYTIAAVRASQLKTSHAEKPQILADL